MRSSTNDSPRPPVHSDRSRRQQLPVLEHRNHLPGRDGCEARGESATGWVCARQGVGWPLTGRRSGHVVVADAIRANPDEYPDVVLGWVSDVGNRQAGCSPDGTGELDTRRMPRDRYISTITQPESWGGAIELSIFAKQWVAGYQASLRLVSKSAQSTASRPRLPRLTCRPVGRTGTRRDNTTRGRSSSTLASVGDGSTSGRLQSS